MTKGHQNRFQLRLRMVEAINKDLPPETATMMENVSARLLLRHNPGTVKLFKLLYLNHAGISLEYTQFRVKIVQVERL